MWKGPVIIVGTIILVLIGLLFHRQISKDEVVVTEMPVFYIDGQIFKLESFTQNEFGLPKFGIVRGRIVKILRDGPYQSKNAFEPLDEDSAQFFEKIKTDYFESLKRKHLTGNE